MRHSILLRDVKNMSDISNELVNAIVFRVIKTEKGREVEVMLQKKDLRYKSAAGKWVLFGGRRENTDKSLKEAIEQELEEELGSTFVSEIKLKKFLIRWRNFQNTKVKRYVYLVQYPFCEREHPLDQISAGEGAGFAFFSKDEILKEYKIFINDPDLKVLKKFFNTKIFPKGCPIY